MRDFLTLLAIAACCGAASAGEQSPAQPSPAAPAPAPFSLQAAIAAAQQVSALQQAEIDERVALEDVRQAKAALLPRAR
ncbi:MAG TPA: twin-arginine translocation signal domain-containing protein, partial [Thermoanaerobaculia bacterium]|nr:twin-arginine translocation signal domain-containing protein [Thermoanaerobaculia bacterium]